ncbi:MAG: flagellar type III secretion system protein FlhB [Leptospiraceae bacterium]|nr:flagellar type III secretion system protein FlhB [Leptospiraceae bacterium]MCP5493077.1 flagellar type III secretion system protein FlhB [Leptospiraceae bacterium]
MVENIKLAAELEYFIDLQFFAAAEDEGRTEEPSERRRREEKEKGNLPKSPELPSALVIMAGMLTVYLMGNYLFVQTVVIIKKYFNNVGNRTTFETEGMTELLQSTMGDVFSLLLPILIVTFITAIAGSVVQVGFVFTPKALGFKFNKLIPNFKRVLPTRQTMFNLAKTLAKVAVVGWISYIIISMDFLSLILAGQMGMKGALKVLANSALKIFLVVGVVLFAISILDYYYQKYEHEQSLKVTPFEARQEMKESEGDKALLNRRRQMVRDFIRRGMLQKVPTADVVVVNPTHFSVALQYDPAVHDAPIVVAKGMDEFALIIRRLAKKHNIPIVEDRVTARLLYDEGEIDKPIPVKFYRAISIIVAKLDKFRKRIA